MAYWRDTTYPEEFGPKLILHLLHEKKREHQLLLAIGSNLQQEIDLRAELVREAQQGVENHPVFGDRGTFADRRKKAANGDLPRLLRDDEIVQRSGLDAGLHGVTWRILSGYAHGHPHALSWLERFNTEDPESARLLGSMIRFAIAYGSWAALQFEKQLPRCGNAFDEEGRARAETNAATLGLDITAL